MLRNKILRSGGGALPTEVIDFGDTYITNNSSTNPTFNINVNYSSGDVLVLFVYAYDSTISLVEFTFEAEQTVNGNEPTSGSAYGTGSLGNTSVFGYYYTADASGTSASVSLNYSSSPQYIYAAMYVLRGLSTDRFSRNRQTWTTGTSDTSVSYEDGVSAIVGFAVYREDAAVTATPFTVTSTLGTVYKEADQRIDSGNGGAVAFSLPYTETTGSSSLTITSDDNASGTTRKGIVAFVF